jgi:hypothetical protein
VADLYQKGLESERRRLWAECRLKGLAKDTPERLRILVIERLLAEHKASRGLAKTASDRLAEVNRHPS